MKQITTSSVVRAIDFQQSYFKKITKQLGQEHRMHRKLWEWAQIARIYQEQIGSRDNDGNDGDTKVLGFGVGREPLAAWLASQGAQVTATDQPLDIHDPADWGEDQYANAKSSLGIGNKPLSKKLDALIDFQHVDMNDIPDSLMRGEFDMTYSSGSFEHIGGYHASINFFINQMKCLKPGGLAVHATEYNYDNIGQLAPLYAKNLVLFKLVDFNVIGELLREAGHRLWDLDTRLGVGPDDHYIAKLPDDMPHLKYTVNGRWNTTSVVLVAEAAQQDAHTDFDLSGYERQMDPLTRSER